MLPYFKENHVSRNPQILEVNGSRFFLDLYTGALISARVGIPAFLLNSPAEPKKREGDKNDSDQRMWGSFRDWNTLARFILDGVESGEITALHKDAIFSWISSYTGCTESVTIPPARKELERFGGEMTDDQFQAKYTPLTSKSVTVDMEEDVREMEKAMRKEKSDAQPPKLAQAIKDVLLTNQLTHLHVTAATPSVFWIERASAPWAPSNVTEAVEKTLKEWELTGARVPEVAGNKLAPEFIGPKKCPRNVAKMFPRPVVAPKDPKPLPTSHVNPSAGPKKRTLGGKNKADITGTPVNSPVSTKTSAPKKNKVAIVTE